jgi:hypothetical protein
MDPIMDPEDMNRAGFSPGTATIVPMGVFAGLLYIVTPDWAVAITGTARCMLGRLLLPLAPMGDCGLGAYDLLVSTPITKFSLVRPRGCRNMARYHLGRSRVAHTRST